MTEYRLVFNPPPGWPKPPEDWTPPKGWEPDPAWPAPPSGWQLWLPSDPANPEQPVQEAQGAEPGAPPDTQQAAQPEATTATPGDPSPSVVFLEAENAALRAQLLELSREGDVVGLDDDRILQDVGIYRYHHPLENALAYKQRLADLNSRIADLVKSRNAIEKSNLFTFDNSLANGRKMTADLAKLMLRAYNAEVDNIVRSLRAGNVVTAKKRIEASRAAIEKLGTMMEMHISDTFHALRLEELELTSDYLMKKQEEHEEAREERARLREERKVAEELPQPCVPTSRETVQHWKSVTRAGENMRHDEIQDRRPSAEP